MYEVIDRQTKIVVGIYSSRSRALKAVIRLDNKYGASRYYHQEIQTI